MCSKNVLRKVIDFEIYEPIIYSDHVMLSYKLNTCYNNNVKDDSEAKRVCMRSGNKTEKKTLL